MRRKFAATIKNIAQNESRLLFLTGDLGFSALEEVQETLGQRFINAGVAEQNMITMAAAMASKGFIPICYSITPFVVYRPFEQIKVDVCLHNANVKIVGNGGGYGYGIMGATHHAIEDFAVMRSMPNMRVFIPSFNADVESDTHEMMRHDGPCYLRLNSPVSDLLAKDARHTNGWSKYAHGNRLVIIAAGGILSSAIEAAQRFDGKVTVWQLRQLPVPEFPNELLEDLRMSNQLLVLEEHIGPGGIGEAIAAQILERGQNLSAFRFERAYARGYPSGRYGSQNWHREESGLSGESFFKQVSNLLGTN
jgi:transketolase